MLIEMLVGKIHRATVTDCSLDYVGSLSVDTDLLEASGLLPFQKIQLLNINNGARIETYIIEGNRGTGELIVNGAAARLFQPGDRVIVCGFGLMDEAEAGSRKPKIVFVDDKNRITNRL